MKNSQKQTSNVTEKKFVPSPTQLQLVKLLVDLDDHRSKEAKCAEVGITKTTLYNWYRNKDFVLYVNELLDLSADSDIADIFRAMKLSAKRGNVQAQRSFLEIRGKFTPKVKHELSGDPNNPIQTVIQVVSGMPTPPARKIEPAVELKEEEVHEDEDL